MRPILAAFVFLTLTSPVLADAVEPDAPASAAAPPEAAPAKAPKTVSGPAFVHDGDTIYIGGKGHRLFGISAPEMDMPGGLEARTVLDDLLAEEGDVVDCSLTGRKTYNRPVVICTAGGRDLAAAVLAAGRAVTWRSYLHGRGSDPAIAADYMAAEAAARSAGLGLWGRSSETAWHQTALWELVKLLAPVLTAFAAFWFAAEHNFKKNRRLQELARNHEKFGLSSAIAAEVWRMIEFINGFLDCYDDNGKLRVTADQGRYARRDFLPPHARIYEANLAKITLLEPVTIAALEELHDSLREIREAHKRPGNLTAVTLTDTIRALIPAYQRADAAARQVTKRLAEYIVMNK